MSAESVMVPHRFEFIMMNAFFKMMKFVLNCGNAHMLSSAGGGARNVDEFCTNENDVFRV